MTKASSNRHHLFEEFVDKPPIDLKENRNDTVIILDTNVLLNFYRNSEKTNNKIIETLNKVKDELWIPNLVMLEFLYDRKKVKLDVKSDFTKTEKAIDVAFKNLKNEVEKQINSLPIASKDLGETRKKILIKENKKMAELSNHLKKSIHEIDEEMVEKENYTELFFELFSNKIGDPFDQERIKEIEKEGANRYEQELPPGYKDASKDDSHVRTFRNVWYHKKYGDLIIWNQILDYVKENDNLKNVVFVTEDKKADWMYIVHDKKIGPRIELKSELLSKADANLIMLDTNNFLMQVNRNTEKLIQSVSERNNYVHSIDDLHDLRALSYMKNEFIDLRREIFKIENMINKLSENKDKLNYLMEKDNSQIDPNYTKILDKEIRDLNYKRQVMMDRLNQLDKDIHLLELKK